MKLALIPPFSHVGLVARTDYQLLLPQCISNPFYQTAYKKARANGSFMILDNGVAEGTSYTVAQLHSAATAMMVNEIVVHDVMNDALATWEAVQAWAPHVSTQFNYMGVLQGNNWDELRWLASRYNAAQAITTVGVPRHLITTMKDNQARLKVVQYLRETYENRFKIHLLGTNPAYIRELADNNKYFDRLNVRGVDTSAPFNYAYAKKSLGLSDVVQRPANYFELPEESFEAGYLDLNLRYMRRFTIND